MKIIDDDAGEVTAVVGGKEVRGWSYKDGAERRIKMQMAHEFAEGWFQGTERRARPATSGDIEDLSKKLDRICDAIDANRGAS
jgi:hypothetical protein